LEPPVNPERFSKFDDFIDIYNNERPHQGIDMKVPADLYAHSPREYRGLQELNYPFHDKTITVTACGRICMGKMKIHLSTVFAGQNVGVKQVEENIRIVSFMNYDLAFFDHQPKKLNRYLTRSIKMCYLCVRNKL